MKQLLTALLFASLVGVACFVAFTTSGRQSSDASPDRTATDVAQNSSHALVGSAESEARAALDDVPDAPELSAAEIIELQDEEGEDAKPFEDFFDSGTMFFPHMVEGPLTVLSHPDGSRFVRAEQASYGDVWERHGRWEVWHTNGERHELGSFTDGFEDGDWTWWWPGGNKMSAGRFERGARVGPWTFYHENGRVAVEGQYEAGEARGMWIHYDENGVKRSEGEMIGGRANGNWASYDEEGRLDPERTGEYINGRRDD